MSRTGLPPASPGSAVRTRAPSAEKDLSTVGVIVPALNEAENLAELLPRLRAFAPGQIIVCDNGSTDDTRGVTRTHGAQHVHQPLRGYGAACFAGIQSLKPQIDIVAFVDADLARDVTVLPGLVAPIAAGEADMVIGARVPTLREPGASSLPQRIGNWLAPKLIRLGWGHAYTDLGPFRAIRRSALDAIDMKDRAYGWTVEMQIRAVELGLRIREVPVPQRRRTRGRSKISGSLRGSALAAYWILRTCAWLWLTRHRRRK